MVPCFRNYNPPVPSFKWVRRVLNSACGIVTGLNRACGIAVMYVCIPIRICHYSKMPACRDKHLNDGCLAQSVGSGAQLSKSHPGLAPASSVALGKLFKPLCDDLSIKWG